MTIMSMHWLFAFGGLWPVNKIALQYTPPILLAGMRAFIEDYSCLRPRRRLLEENWLLYSISALFSVIILWGSIDCLQYLTWFIYGDRIFAGSCHFACLLFLKESNIPESRRYFDRFVALYAMDGLTGKISLLGVFWQSLRIRLALGTIHIKKTKEFADEMWMVACQNMIGGFFLRQRV